MNLEQWRNIHELFEAALQQPVEERAAFLARACAGDDETRRRIEAMLDADARDDLLMDRPAYHAAGSLIASMAGADDSQIVSGEMIGVYRLIRELGHGGMGRVYLAYDTRLRRQAALKLLPARLIDSPERVHRLQREARAATALNHPNIITIYDFGEENGRHYIASEFIEGGTLRDSVGDPQLTLNEILEVAVQVGRALDAAHTAGIVHRDIKPENVIRRPDGYVKVLDFGLAKLNEPESGDEAEAAASRMTSEFETRTGVVLGTVNYMSPEQVRGQKVDGRSDLFSLGVVLYELITGHRPFGGESWHHTMVAITDIEPEPIERYAKGAPAALQQVITRVLAKDREERYQTARELLADLEKVQGELADNTRLQRVGSASTGRLLPINDRRAAQTGTHLAGITAESKAHKVTGTGSVIASLKRHRKVAALMLSLTLIGVAGIASWIHRLFGPEPTQVAGNVIGATALTRTGTVGGTAISPDGRQIVYSVHEGGRESLWLRQVAASSAQQLVPPAEVTYSALAFSRDGNHIYFTRWKPGESVRALYRMAALGGEAMKLIEDIDSAITLSPDGTRIAFVRYSSDESALMIADADGSNVQKLAARPLTDCFKIPAWSPDGKVIACSVGSGERYDIQNSFFAVRVDDGTQASLTPQKWAATHWVEWLTDGSGLLVTARARHEAPDQIWHIAYPSGTARRLTSDSKMYRSMSLAADSQTLVAVQTELHSEIWIAPAADAARARKLTSGNGSYSDACFMPDGRIVYASQASGNWDIWVMNADGSGQKQLTADAGVNLHQAVSPDGHYIVFASNRAGVFNIWRMDSDGGNLLQLTSGGGEKFPSCSPDGKWVLYNSVASDQGYYAPWKVPIEGGEPVRLPGQNFGNLAMSPDGKYVAHIFSSDGKAKIEVTPFAGGPPAKILDTAEDVEPLPYVHWFPDGQSLTYSASRNDVSNVWMQPLDGGPAKQLTDFKAEGWLSFDWSRDGKQLVITRRLWISDLVLLRTFVPKSD